MFAEPRCYLFVVFDCLRRIFLTSILTLFNEAEVSQIGLAIFGSFLSYRVFSFYAPYVDDEDDLLSNLANTQLILHFIGAMLIYVSKEAGYEESTFNSTAFAVVLVTVFSMTFLVAVWILLVSAFGAQDVERSTLETSRYLWSASSVVSSLRGSSSSLIRRISGRDGSLADLDKGDSSTTEDVEKELEEDDNSDDLLEESTLRLSRDDHALHEEEHPQDHVPSSLPPPDRRSSELTEVLVRIPSFGDSDNDNDEEKGK